MSRWLGVLGMGVLSVHCAPSNPPPSSAEQPSQTAAPNLKPSDEQTAAFVDDGQGPLVVDPSASGFRVVDNQAIVKALPKGEKWIQHVQGDLLKFWDQKTALGEPLGNFPTYRCNDGSLWDEQKPCPELKNADPSIVRLDRDYTRAKSRQIFAYGVAFHLTGHEKYLGYAVAGADWLSKNALDQSGAAS